MKRYVGLILVLCSTAIFAADITLQSKSLYDMTLSFQTTKKDVSLQSLVVGNETFGRLSELGTKVQPERVGQPEIPKLHRWIAVDPAADYEVIPVFSNPVVYQNVTLYPVQPDTLDNGQVLPFVKSEAAYNNDSWMGEEQVEVGKKMKLAGATILPITLVPAAYNPARKELKIYQTAEVKIVAKAPTDSTVAATRISAFAKAQISALVLNHDQYLKSVRKERAHRYMIFYPPRFEKYAKKLGERYEDQEISVHYSVVKPDTQPADIKAAIQKEYNGRGLDSVLLFGNEIDIPLQTMGGSVGDFDYSLLSGDDEVSDIAIGRIPASSEANAALMLNKIEKFKALHTTSKKVMMIAHNEDYPQKYTGNLESIIKAPNPRGFQYKPLYGGNGATNEDVLREAAQGYAIINYRGHGSEINWIEWDSKDKSFGFSEIDQLTNSAANMAFIFNVACDNGAIQQSRKVLVEKELFPTEDSYSLKGAIGTFGATEPSYTIVNHDFNRHLFHYLQTEDDLTIGNIYTLANNKLTQDAGGTAPQNVKMYILYSDPLLAPRLMR